MAALMASTHISLPLSVQRMRRRVLSPKSLKRSDRSMNVSSSNMLAMTFSLNPSFSHMQCSSVILGTSFE